MRVLVPLKRDVRTIPPLLSLIKGLAAQGHDVHFLCYFCDAASLAGSNHSRLTVEMVSDKPYPKSALSRLLASIRGYAALWRHLLAHAHTYDCVWLASWDFRYFGAVARWTGLRAPTVWQLHEYEPERFGRVREADVVVVPEENRAWLTYFAANLATKPLVLPNIPIDHPRQRTGVPEIALARQKDAGKKVVLYQGYIHLEKRCLAELFRAVAILPEQFVLAIMPVPDADSNQVERARTEIRRLGLEARVVWLESRNAPYHLDVLAQADVGVGLYRPTSLNQVYCAPNRLYEFTGFGLPVVLPKFPGLEQLSAKYPGIVTCDPEDENSIAAAVLQLADNEVYESMAMSARRFFDEEADYSRYLSTVLDEVKRVTARSGVGVAPKSVTAESLAS